MKSYNPILTLFLFLITFSAQSQTPFWTESFDGVVCGLPGNSACDPSIVAWTTVATGGQGASANRFYISCRENGNAVGACGSGCGANQTLHIGNVATSTAAFFFCPNGDCGAAYDASGAAEVTSKRCESPTINCTNYTGISATFKYIEGGQTTLDNATLWYFDGAIWAQIDNMPKTATGCGGQGIWATRTVALPASANNNPNVKIGFRWVNNGDGAGSDPSFAVNDIVVSYTATLPIELLYFDASLQGNNVFLEWVTESEINNDYFTIERSENAINYYSIFKTEGAGNSNTSKYYYHLDKDPSSNKTLYYRLKQTDFDGKFSYSDVISIQTNSNDYDIIYDNHNLSVTSTNSRARIEIYDLMGKVVYSNNLINSQKISTSKFNSGIYIVKIGTPDNLVIRKIKF